jgi:arsenate reductase
MITVYHNPKCRKSREGLQLVKDQGVEMQVVEYLRTPFTRETLTRLLAKLNLKPEALVRTQEAEYKTSLRGKNFTDEEWIEILLKNPKLIQRPIVDSGIKAVVGQTAADIMRLF